MTAFVAGAATGIGGAKARAFAASGFEVASGGLHPDVVERVASDETQSITRERVATKGGGRREP